MTAVVEEPPLDEFDMWDHQQALSAERTPQKRAFGKDKNMQGVLFVQGAAKDHPTFLCVGWACWVVIADCCFRSDDFSFAKVLPRTVAFGM